MSLSSEDLVRELAMRLGVTHILKPVPQNPGDVVIPIYVEGAVIAEYDCPALGSLPKIAAIKKLRELMTVNNHTIGLFFAKKFVEFLCEGGEDVGYTVRRDNWRLIPS